MKFLGVWGMNDWVVAYYWTGYGWVVRPRNGYGWLVPVMVGSTVTPLD